MCNTPDFENVASFLIDMATKSARKLLFEPSATVGLGLCSAATHEVSYDPLVAALELRALTSVIGQACESLIVKLLIAAPKCSHCDFSRTPGQ